MFLRTHLTTLVVTRGIKRWVAPTLRELRKRKHQFDKNLPNPRSGFIEWNYRAELFAFGKRLNEDFNIEILQTAFLDRSYVNQEEETKKKLGIFDPEYKMEDNRKLIEKGDHLIRSYINKFLTTSLVDVPDVGITAIRDYLSSVDTLSHVAVNLGVKDLIPSDDATNITIADTFKAIIGALEESSGIERAHLFIRDFICTQLSQKEITEIWNIENPIQVFADLCRERNLGDPEPRLLGDAGKNTILGTYFIGIYCNRKLMGTGFGESIEIAIESATRDCLSSLYGIKDDMKPFNFQINKI